MRTKRGVTQMRRHKKIRKLAKGFRLRNRTTFRTAKQAVMKAGMHAYRDRRLKKRTFRSLWIVRLNAALRAHGTNYSTFMAALRLKGIVLNRKALSELAVNDAKSFSLLVEKVRAEGALAPAAARGIVYKHAERTRPALSATEKAVKKDEKKAKKVEAKKPAPRKKAATKKPAPKKA